MPSGQRTQPQCTTIEVHLVGLMGEINKLVVVLNTGVIIVYDADTQDTRTLADACTRLGRADRAQLLEEVDKEMGYVEEKLKTLRRVRVMLSPATEVGDGCR